MEGVRDGLSAPKAAMAPGGRPVSAGEALPGPAAGAGPAGGEPAGKGGGTASDCGAMASGAGMGRWLFFNTVISPHSAHCSARGLFMNPQLGQGVLGLFRRLIVFSGKMRCLAQVHFHRRFLRLGNGKEILLPEAEKVCDDIRGEHLALGVQLHHGVIVELAGEGDLVLG